MQENKVLPFLQLDYIHRLICQQLECFADGMKHAVGLRNLV